MPQPTNFLCIRIGIDLDVFSTLESRNGTVALEEVAVVRGADPVLIDASIWPIVLVIN